MILYNIYLKSIEREREKEIKKKKIVKEIGKIHKCVCVCVCDRVFSKTVSKSF